MERLNQIESLAGDGRRLYAAGGDLGLLSWNTTTFQAPFPLRSDASGAVSSLRMGNDSHLFSAPASSGLRLDEFDPSEGLQMEQSWAAEAAWTILDARGSSVLAQSGGVVTLWNAAATPVAVGQVTPSGSVARGVLLGSRALLLLGDGSLWSADYSTSPATLTAVSLSGAHPSDLVRGDQSVALVELSASGTTLIRYFADGDLSMDPEVVEIEGLATGTVAVDDAHRGAAATYRGTLSIDFDAGKATAIPGSNTVIARGVALVGSDILVMTGSDLLVRTWSTGELMESFGLPEEGLALSVPSGGTVAAIRTASGIMTLRWNAATGQPGMIESDAVSHEYGSQSIGGKNLYLLEDSTVEIRSLRGRSLSAAVQSVVLAPGIIDMTASGSGFCTLESSGAVSCHSPSGALQERLELQKGGDAVFLSLHHAGDLLLVSFSHGCLSGTCSADTVVLDEGLSELTTLTGKVVDVTTEGDGLWMITQSPDELRRYTLESGSLQLTASTASEGNPVSIAASTTLHTVYSLGARLVGYDASTLLKGAAQLDSWTGDSGNGLPYIAQMVRIDGGCALVSGRWLQPRLFSTATANQWIQVPSPESPSPVRSVEQSEGSFHLLTDQSVEVWSRLPLPARRHPVH